MLELIRKKIEQNSPISEDEAYFLYKEAPREDLRQCAELAKSRFHEKNSATYVIMSILNYTNICVAGCKYCSFYAYPHQKEGYLLSYEEVTKKVDLWIEKFNPDLVSFNGGFHPGLKLEDYASFFEKIHTRYPALTFYEMTVAEFIFACRRSKLSLHEGAKLLRNAGTQWVTGGGAEILTDSFRQRQSPGKQSVQEYYDGQQAIIEEKIGSTATMVIGFDESLEERFEHLRVLRNFQSKMDGKLASFLCWTYKPYNNELGGEEISNEEYLRWLATCRIYLNNFKHLRTSVLTRNEGAFEGLAFGADDFDLPIEDEVTEKAGSTISHDFEELLGLCEKRGFHPVRREVFKNPSAA